MHKKRIRRIRLPWSPFSEILSGPGSGPRSGAQIQVQIRDPNLCPGSGSGVWGSGSRVWIANLKWLAGMVGRGSDSGLVVPDSGLRPSKISDFKHLRYPILEPHGAWGSHCCPPRKKATNGKAPRASMGNELGQNPHFSSRVARVMLRCRNKWKIAE